MTAKLTSGIGAEKVGKGARTLLMIAAVVVDTLPPVTAEATAENKRAAKSHT